MADRVMRAGLRWFMHGGAWELPDDELDQIADAVFQVRRSRAEDWLTRTRAELEQSEPFWLEWQEGWKLHLAIEVEGYEHRRAVQIKAGCGVKSEQGIDHVVAQRERRAGPREAERPDPGEGRAGGLCGRCTKWARRHDVEVPRRKRNRKGRV